jgi:hypothetical protein
MAMPPVAVSVTLAIAVYAFRFNRANIEISMLSVHNLWMDVGAPRLGSLYTGFKRPKTGFHLMFHAEIYAAAEIPDAGLK